MTIKLLTPWNGIPALARLTLDSGTETGLVNAKQATTDLTGAIDYVPPKFKPYPVDVFQDPDTGQFVESDGSPLVSGAGNVAVKNPAGLDAWRRMLADALFVSPRIMCVGDSTTFGIGSAGTGSEGDTSANAPSYPGQLRTLLGRIYGASAGVVHARQTDLVVAANTQTAFSTFGLAGYTHGINSTGPGTLTFSLPACTAYDIIYYENTSAGGGAATGSFSYTTDAGGATVVANGGADQTYKTVSVTGLTNAPHTVVITGTTANTARVCGIVYYTPGSSVAVGRFGRPGWTLADLMGYGYQNLQTNAAQRDRLTTAFTQAGPGLIILPIGINEWGKQGASGSNIDNGSGHTYTTPEYLSRQLDILIAHIAASQSSLLLVVPGAPANPDAAPAAGVGPTGLRRWSEYVSVLESKAVAGSPVALIDTSDRWGDYTAANAAGLMYDTVHPTRRGYGDQARAMLAAITS